MQYIDCWWQKFSYGDERHNKLDVLLIPFHRTVRLCDDMFPPVMMKYKFTHIALSFILFSSLFFYALRNAFSSSPSSLIVRLSCIHNHSYSTIFFSNERKWKKKDKIKWGRFPFSLCRRRHSFAPYTGDIYICCSFVSMRSCVPPVYHCEHEA